eukprot:419232_1
MDLQDIATINVLNIDKEESTISATDLITRKNINDNSFIVSDADEELLILISFTDVVNLKAINICALSPNSNEMSQPKTVHVYKTKHTNLDFEDIKLLKPDKTIKCKKNKLEKGQAINLQKTSKNIVKFKKVQCFAIYIDSNQNDTEITFINAISFDGEINDKYKNTTSDNSLKSKQKNKSHPASFSTKLREIIPQIPFDVEDVVIYQGQEARVIRICNENEIEIAYPISDDITRSNRNIVPHHQIQHSIIADMLEKDHNSFKESTSIKRLFAVIKYYSSLNMNNQREQAEFNEFMNSYYEFLDDYICLLLHYGDQLYDIQQHLIHDQQLGICDILKCVYTSRHFKPRIHRRNQANKTDAVTTFYKEMMDSLHFYFFHVYDCGLRTNEEENKENYNDDNESEDTYIDPLFASISRTIEARQHNTRSFHRFQKNNKFNISIQHNQNDFNTYRATVFGNAEKAETFRDEIFKRLKRTGATNIVIDKFKEIINSEEYDSEAIADDIMSINHGNIYKYISHRECIDSITKLIKAAQSSKTSFNVGYRFYYWKYYQNIKQNLNDQQEMVESTYDICDLFVNARYSCLKEEILRSGFITIDVYKNKILIKATRYSHTAHVKRITAADVEKILHYGIIEGTMLGLSNLISIILYTDYDLLQSHFTSTFRRVTTFEAISSVKARNSEYFWMSKILRETVEVFGQCNIGDWDGINEPKRNPENRINKLNGPFYTGMSMVMLMPQFNMTLCSPTSTSVHIEVAIKFCRREGIVIQLNNNNAAAGLLRGFDCSWMSRYADEDERLFFGGLYRIKNESVRIKKTKQNFEEFFTSLFYFDAMITGALGLGDIPILRTTSKIISLLMKWKLHKEKNENIAAYIYDSFECFCQNKQQISLNLMELANANRKMTKLIIHFSDNKDCPNCGDNLGRYTTKQKNGVVCNICKVHVETGVTFYACAKCGVIKCMDCGEKVAKNNNLFHKELLDIFENVSIFVINASGHSFSLLGLLSMIESSSLEQVVIKANRWKKINDSWINSLWSSTSSIQIQRKYHEKKFTVSMKHPSKCTD